MSLATKSEFSLLHLPFLSLLLIDLCLVYHSTFRPHCRSLLARCELSMFLVFFFLIVDCLSTLVKNYFFSIWMHTNQHHTRVQHERAQISNWTNIWTESMNYNKWSTEYGHVSAVKSFTMHLQFGIFVNVCVRSFLFIMLHWKMWSSFEFCVMK